MRKTRISPLLAAASATAIFGGAILGGNSQGSAQSQESALQASIQPDLQITGGLALELYSSNAECSMDKLGKTAVGITCTKENASDAMLTVGMGTINGRPNPQSTFFAQLDYGESAGSASTGDMQLSAPNGKTDMGAGKGPNTWMANEDRITGVGTHTEGIDLNTTDPHKNSSNGQPNISSVVDTAAAIADDFPNMLHTTIDQIQPILHHEIIV